MISQLIFILCFVSAIILFARNARQIYKNIKIGRALNRNDKPAERLKTMLLVAFGQKKMFKRIVPAVLHLFVYIGFCIINIEMIEIVIDGMFGTHRFLSFLGGSYNFLIASFEWLAFGVLVSCIIFFMRRNVVHLKRLNSPELKNWPKTDANLILIAEILLMTAFLLMNAADQNYSCMANHITSQQDLFQSVSISFPFYHPILHL